MRWAIYEIVVVRELAPSVTVERFIAYAETLDLAKKASRNHTRPVIIREVLP